MKQKPMIYVLILGVVLVWALIILKIIKASTDEGETPVWAKVNDQQSISEKWYMKAYPTDTFGVEGLLNDPFQEQKVVTTTAPKEQLGRKKQIIPSISVRWPMIQYQGFAAKRNQQQGRFALLSINQQPVLLKEGEEEAGVLLKKNWGDSVLLSYQSILKKYYLQQP